MKTIPINTVIFTRLMDMVEEIYILLKRRSEDLKLIHKAAIAWLDSDEAASFLKIDRRTLRTYRIKGYLAYSRIGKIIYYRLDDLEGLLRKYYTKTK